MSSPHLVGNGRTGDGAAPAGLVQLFVVLRRRIQLIGIFTASTFFLVTLVVLWKRPLYRATATVRQAFPRRALTVGVEDVPVDRAQESDPLLSLIELLRGRAVVGAVVDSLGLRLQSLGSSGRWFGASSRLVRAALQNVHVSADAPEDTIPLTFSATRVSVRGHQGQSVSYGVPLTIESVRFTVPAYPGVSSATLVVRSRERVIDQVLDILAVVRRKSTDIVDITYSDPDPHRAQDVTNELVRVFQAGDAGSAQGQARQRAEFLATQIAANDSAITEAEGELTAFRRRRLLANTDGMVAAEQDRLTSLDARRGELAAQRKVFESFVARFDSANDSVRLEVAKDLSYAPELAADPVVSRMSQQVLVYQSRLDSLTTGPFPAAATNPDVIQLKALIQSTQDVLERTVRAHLTSIDAQTQALGTLQASTGAAIQALPATKAEEMRLQRRVDGLKTTGDRIEQEYENARMAEAISAGEAQVIDWAPLPYRPAGVPSGAKLGLGLILGLLLGCVAAVVVESVNTAIMRPEELERTLNMRDLGVIPPLVELSPGRLSRRRPPIPLFSTLGRRPPSNGNGEDQAAQAIMRAPALSVGAEAFRLLYSGLTFGWGPGHRSILVTSVAPQEGKTVIAANLAVTFAREGARVLLVDCDLRRPRLHRLFGVPSAPGLFEWQASHGEAPGSSDGSGDPTAMLLAGAVPGVRPTDVAGLWVLPCGAIPPRSTEMVKPQRIRSLLTRCASQFDLILLDTPPVLVSADAAVLAPLTDGAILVIRAGQTDRASAERASQLLIGAGAHFLGAVLNDPGGEVSRYRKLYYSYEYHAPPG